MAKRKAGLPEGFTLEVEKPDEKPVRSGDYLDEMLSPASVSTPAKSPDTGSEPAAVEIDNNAAPPKTKVKPTTTAASAALGPASKRTRLNVSNDARKRLGKIVEQMKTYGPEPDVRASEVLEALILALYDSREHLDLSNVRRRGRYGSTSHKNFPIALAESVAGAMATSQADKLL